VREIQRVLFVRTDRMGDVLMNLPALRLLRQTFPKAWLTLLVDVSVAGLFKGHPDVDELMTVDAARFKRDFYYRWHLVKVLKRASFDLAVVSNPDKWLHAVVFAARIPHRVGYARKWGFMLTKKMPDRKAAAHRHEIDMNLELASLACDRTWDGHVELPVDDVARRDVRGLFLRDLPGDRPVVAIHPGTSNPKKRWDEGRFAEICRRLSAEGFGTVLIGGPEEKEASARVAAASGVAPADWTGAFSLACLAAFFSEPRVRALVSSDSGPVHVAWISGVPVVALYASDVEGSDPVRWGPRDKKSVTIHKSMADITADEVYAALKKVLAA